MIKERELDLIKAQNIARAGTLYAPSSFKLASVNTLLSICNGCGAANARFDFIPDRIYGTSIRAACQIHDFMYHVGRTIEDKEEADRVFLNNMKRLIDLDKHKCYKPTWLQYRRAMKYHYFVDKLGGTSFWKGKPN